MSVQNKTYCDTLCVFFNPENRLRISAFSASRFLIISMSFFLINKKLLNLTSLCSNLISKCYVSCIDEQRNETPLKTAKEKVLKSKTKVIAFRLWISVLGNTISTKVKILWEFLNKLTCFDSFSLHAASSGAASCSGDMLTSLLGVISPDTTRLYNTLIQCVEL